MRRAWGSQAVPAEGEQSSALQTASMGTMGSREGSRQGRGTVTPNRQDLSEIICVRDHELARAQFETVDYAFQK